MLASRSGSVIGALKICSHWTNTAAFSRITFDRAGIGVMCASNTKAAAPSYHVLSQKNVTSTNRAELGVKRCWRILNAAQISTFFIKERREREPIKTTRFDRDEHYEKVCSQNFGPVPASQSEVPSMRYAESSRQYAKRNHLDFDGLKYDRLPVASITAKYNNTFIYIRDHANDKVYASECCGKAGFKNAAKKTLHAAEMVGKQAAEKALLKGSPENIRVRIKGPGYGRAAAIRGLTMGGLKVASITDITPLHTEGLPQRPRKIRRV